jgi:outer membrane protein OmpA-like peptidoglycan-associated protein
MKNKITLTILIGLLLTCSIWAQENASDDVELKNLTELNSEFLEFSPIPFKDGLIFTSSRRAGGILSCPPSESGRFSDLYFSKKGTNGAYEEAKILKGKVNGKYNDGVATFGAGGQKMYFSRNNIEGKNVNNMIDRKIYSADLIEGNWTNINNFPYNSDTFSTSHPTLSYDGLKLYFSSNREGGFGGMDLYVTEMINDQWSEPKNLGEKVNSTGNEIFPFIDNSGNLFFSSDGHAGEGGLDIWAVVPDESGDWGELTSMGAPFNSSFDDLAFSTNADGTEGFFASSREGGLGMDDIYSWKYAPEPLEAIIIVYDEDTGEELEKVPVSITPVRLGSTIDKIFGKAAVEQKIVIETDPLGALTYQVKRESEYALHAEKPGYIPADRLVTTLELTKDGEYRIPIKRDRVLVDLTGLVVNKETNESISMADVIVIDKSTGEEVEMKSDENGNFGVEIDCKHDYEMKASKDGFADGSINLTSILTDCTNNILEQPVIKLAPKVKIVLEGVYFDFDKATLRPEGKEALNTVVNYLKRYPTLEILLTAHTDCRGSDEYNMDLSERRAKSAIDYIGAEGIDASRYSSKGFGESKLVNECDDGVKCTKEQHQANRRVEVEITKFEEENVEIEK